MGLAFFDADGTLFPNPSSESRFIRRLLREGRLGPRQLAHAAAFMLRAWPCYGRHTARKNKAYLTGLEVESLRALGARFVDEEIAPLLRPALLERIQAHRRAGDRVVLLTGTLDCLAQALGQALAMDEVIAARPLVVEGRFAPGPPLQHPLGMEKLDLARRTGERLGIPPNGWTAYGDSRFDLPLLRASGRAVAVDPDAELAREAQRRGWEILQPREALSAG